MVRHVISSAVHSFLVARDRDELRAWLRARRIRPEAGAFTHILPPPCMELATYRLSGDEHLKILALGLPRITWGALMLALVLPRRPNYRARG
jgi:hypothetical protein